MRTHLTGILAVFGLALLVGLADLVDLGAVARADVATDRPRFDATYLYYRDGADVVRARCQTGTTLYDRSTCRTEPIRVPEAELHAEAAAHYGNERDLHDRTAGEIYTKISRIDVKLLEFLADVPDVAEPDLRDAIASGEADLAEASQRVADLADQIARAEAELAQHEDPDLRATLRALTDSHGAALVERESRQAALNTVRQRFITANARLLDESTYRALQSQRSQLVSDLGREHDALAAEVDKSVKLNKAMRLIADQSFVWEHFGSSSFDTVAAVTEIGRAYDVVDERHRTFTGDVTSDDFISVVVPIAGPLQSIECAFTGVTAADPRLYVSGGPSQFMGHVRGTQFFVADGHFTGALDQVFHDLPGRQATGVWMFMVTDGDAAWATAQSGRCAIIVGR